jgi:hypothetical protein
VEVGANESTGTLAEGGEGEELGPEEGEIENVEETLTTEVEYLEEDEGEELLGPTQCRVSPSNEPNSPYGVEYLEEDEGEELLGPTQCRVSPIVKYGLTYF